MKTQPLFLTALFLVLLCTGSLALGLSAPEKIPSNVNWSFFVTLEGTGNTDVFLDDQKIVTAYSNGRVTVDPNNGSRVLYAQIFDRVLYVSYMGLSSGTYEVRATGSNGNETAIFEVFNPLDEKLESEINSRLENAITDKEQTLAQINSLEQDLLQTKNRLTEKENEINSLRTQLENANSEISNLNSLLSEEKNNSADKFSGLTQRLGAVETEVFPEPVAAEDQQNFLSGFAGLSGFAQQNWIGVFLMLVAAAIVAFVFARKTFLKKNSVYGDFDSQSSGGFFEKKLNEAAEDSNKEDESEDDEDEESDEDEPEEKGKWAFKK